MICNSGHENADGALFCRVCGVSLNGNVSVSSPGAYSSVSTQSIGVQSLKNDLIADLNRHRNGGHATTLQSTMTMVCGALFAFAVITLALYAVESSDSDNPYVSGVIWTILGCVATYLVVKFVSDELITAATTAFIPLSIVTVLLLFGTQLEEGKTGLAFLIAGLASLVSWVLPILRGRPALLANGLFMTGLGLLILMVQSSITDTAECGYYEDCLDDPSAIFSTTAEKSATLMLVLGIVLLAVAWVLDRRVWPHLGRTFIGVGIDFEVVGAFGVYQSASDKTAGSLLLALAGVLLIAVAVRKSRKASLIIGGIGTWLGITAFIGAITSDNENPTAYAILMILASVGIGFLALKRAQAITNAIQQRP